MPIAQASAIVVNQSHEEQVSRSRTQSSSSSPDFAATTFLRVKAITMTASTTIPAAVNPAIRDDWHDNLEWEHTILLRPLRAPRGGQLS